MNINNTWKLLENLGFTKEELQEIRETILAREYEYEEEMRRQAQIEQELASDGKLKVI